MGGRPIRAQGGRSRGQRAVFGAWKARAAWGQHGRGHRLRNVPRPLEAHAVFDEPRAQLARGGDRSLGDEPHRQRPRPLLAADDGSRGRARDRARRGQRQRLDHALSCVRQHLAPFARLVEVFLSFREQDLHDQPLVGDAVDRGRRRKQRDLERLAALGEPELRQTGRGVAQGRQRVATVAAGEARRDASGRQQGGPGNTAEVAHRVGVRGARAVSIAP